MSGTLNRVLNVLGSVAGTFLVLVGLLGIIGGDILTGIMIMIRESFLMPLHDPFHEVSSGVRLGGLSCIIASIVFYIAGALLASPLR